MKKQLATLALAIAMGALGFAVAGVAAAGNGQPPSPPGQGECEHGNSGQPCKEDPQPDKGKDCEEHGNQGGVNEDHCKGEDTTTTDTTVTTDTTSTETTPSETTPSETTPSVTTPSQTTPSQTTPTEPSSNESSKPAPAILAKPPLATSANEKGAVLGSTTDARKPTRQAQEAPFTL